MQLRQIAELIAERVGRQTDNTFIRIVEDMVVYTRARILTNTIEKRPAMSKYFTQAFVIDLEEVNGDECEELADCNCENVLRTTKDIPQPLKAGAHPFDYFGSPAGANAFGWTTFGSEKFMSQSPITGKRSRYTYLNNRGYVFNNKNITKVRIEGVFSDPRQLKLFTCIGSDAPCYSETGDFPMDDATTQIVVKSILETELRFLPDRDTQIKVNGND